MDIGLFKAMMGEYGDNVVGKHLISLLPCPMTLESRTVEKVFLDVRQFADSAGFKRYASLSIKGIVKDCLEMLDCMQQGVDIDEEVLKAPWFQQFLNSCEHFFFLLLEDEHGTATMLTGRQGMRDALYWLDGADAEKSLDMCSRVL